MWTAKHNFKTACMEGDKIKVLWSDDSSYTLICK